MFCRVVSFVLVLCLFGLLSAQSAGDYRSYQSGNWHDLTTWQSFDGESWVNNPIVPNDVIANQITISAGHTVTVNNNIAIDQTVVAAGGALNLAVNKTITVNNGDGDDLQVDGTLRIEGDANQNSIGVTGSGKVIISGACYWYSGGITNTNFWIAPAGIMHIQGGASKIMRANARIYNQGTVQHYDGGGVLIGVGNSIFDNLEGGIYHAMGSCSIRYEYAYDWYNQYTFNNSGSITKSGDGSTFTIYRGTFNNYGNIQLQAGILLLNGTGTRTSSGPIVIDAGAVLRLHETSPLDLNEGTQISGGGTLLLDQNSTNTILRVYGGTEGIPVSEDTLIDYVTGKIAGTGKLVIGGDLLWKGGYIEGPRIELTPTATLRIQAGSEKRLVGSILDNYGLVIHETSEFLNGNNGAVINNQPEALWDLSQNGYILHRSDLGGARTTFNNYGTLQNGTTSENTYLDRITFNNNNLCQVQSGSLRLISYGGGGNYGSLVVSAGATFSVGTNFEWTMAEDSSISGSGLFKLDGGKLPQSGTTNGATIGVDIAVQMTGGQISGSGKLTLLGDMIWSGGEIMCGSFIISENSTVTGTGTTAELRTSGYGNITNFGHLCLTAAVGSGNITYLNQPDAIIEFGLGSSIWHTGGGAGSTTLTNYGTIRKTGNSTSNLNRTNITNNGIVEALEGTLQLELSSFNNNGQVNAQGGNLKLYRSSSGSGTGNYYIAEDCQLIVSDSYSLTCQEGAEILGNGTIQLLSGGGLNTAGTTNGLFIAETIAIDQAGGNLGGAGKLYFNGSHTWSEGNLQVANYYLGADGSLNLSSTATKRLSGSFHNYGLVQMSGSMGGGNLNLYNYADAEIQIPGGLSIWHTGGGSAYPKLYNYGLVHKYGSEGAYCDVLSLNNYGEIYLETGTLTFYCSSNPDYNQAGSGAVYHVAGKLVLRYGNVSTNNVGIILDGPDAKIWNQSDTDLLSTCTGTSASGSFTLRNGANLTTNVNFTNSGTLDLGTGILGGNGNFSTASNSNLILGSPDGINLSGALGNIQKTGTRSYATTANYSYISAAAQSCGDGLPQTMRSLTVNNPAGLTIGSPVSVTQLLDLVSGPVLIPSLSLGSAVSAGTLQRDGGFIAGDMCLWLETTATEVLFPVGSPAYYRPVNLSFAAEHSSGGSLSLSTIYAYPETSGLPLTDAETTLETIGREAYWRLSAADGLQCGTFDLSILAEGYAGIEDYTLLHLLSRPEAQNPWQNPGTHIPCTGSNNSPWVARQGLDSWGEFALGSTAINFAYLDPVQNLQISRGETGINLHWDAASGEVSYRVYASSDPAVEFPQAWSLVADNLDTPQWTDPLPDGSHRFYIVTVRN